MKKSTPLKSSLGKVLLSDAEIKEKLLAHIVKRLGKETPRYLDIYRKIIDVKELPTRNECMRLMRAVDKKFGGGVYGDLLVRKGYFQVVHEEIIRDLTALLNQLNTTRNIEICAGVGKLSYWINKKGIKITATDSGRRVKSGYVDQMDYRDAIRRFKPETVIAAWPMPMGVGLISNVVRYPSVQNLVIIGKGGYMARKYWRRIYDYGEVIPLDIRSSPSQGDSMLNDSEYDKPRIERSIKKFFQVGDSNELHQSVLIRAVRK